MKRFGIFVFMGIWLTLLPLSTSFAEENIVIALLYNNEKLEQGAVLGARIKVDEINAAGGIQGKKVVLWEFDHEDKLELVAAGVKAAKSQRAIAILTPSRNLVVKAMISENKNGQIPLLSLFATEEFEKQEAEEVKKSYYFQLALSEETQGERMAYYAWHHLKAKSASIYVSERSSFSFRAQEGFEKTFLDLGGKILIYSEYSEIRQDYEEILKLSRTYSSDVIFAPGFPSQSGPLIKNLRVNGISTPILGGSDWYLAGLQNYISSEHLSQIYFLTDLWTRAYTPQARDFMKEFQRIFETVPNGVVLLAYDSVGVLKQGLDQSARFEGGSLQEELEKISKYDGLSGEINLGVNHQADRSVGVLGIQEGKMYYMEELHP